MYFVLFNLVCYQPEELLRGNGLKMAEKSYIALLLMCCLATATASAPAANAKLKGAHTKSAQLGYHRPDYHGITYKDGIPVYGQESSFYGPRYFQGQGHESNGLQYQETDNGQNPPDLHELFQVPNRHQYPIYHETPKETGMYFCHCLYLFVFNYQYTCSIR